MHRNAFKIKYATEKKGEFNLETQF